MEIFSPGCAARRPSVPPHMGDQIVRSSLACFHFLLSIQRVVLFLSFKNRAKRRRRSAARPAAGVGGGCGTRTRGPTPRECGDTVRAGGAGVDICAAAHDDHPRALLHVRKGEGEGVGERGRGAARGRLDEQLQP